MSTLITIAIAYVLIAVVFYGFAFAHLSFYEAADGERFNQKVAVLLGVLWFAGFPFIIERKIVTNDKVYRGFKFKKEK